jgi:hypothetical protein
MEMEEGYYSYASLCGALDVTVADWLVYVQMDESSVQHRETPSRINGTLAATRRGHLSAPSSGGSPPSATSVVGGEGGRINFDHAVSNFAFRGKQ